MPATTSSPPVAGLGTEVDDPVGAFDDLEVVLDDEQRIALLHEPLKTLTSSAMSSKCRPVVGSSRMSRQFVVALLGQSLDELEPLRIRRR